MHQIDDSMKILGKGITAENRAMLDELKDPDRIMTTKGADARLGREIDEKSAGPLVSTSVTRVETRLHAHAETAIVDSRFKDADTVIRNKLSGMKATGHGVQAGRRGFLRTQLRRTSREVRHLRARDARRLPWKNGRGGRRVRPLAASSSFERGDFDWRISPRVGGGRALLGIRARSDPGTGGG